MQFLRKSQKLVIVNDHPLIRKGFQSLFHLETSIANRQEAFELITKLEPDIATIDLRLGADSGLELVREGIRKGMTCKFVILTSSVVKSDFKLA